MPSHEHACQRADDAEAACRNLILFGRFFGNHGQTYPLRMRVKALRLLGRTIAAQILLDQAARQQAAGQIVTIPTQRRPHPSEHRLTNRVRNINRGDNQ